ncbi:hypothetical protein PHLCEN_2v3509 [Hermanssonia centrifuga]|uniref:Hydrophobin n=1 Tax=Hermanssonia centrifuga TaxID=98765 RepID=A0A2R6QEY6_9APHY|nr:hypothetical protein PHLCEN_2v3509 [Hermanssonia centrifuga]
MFSPLTAYIALVLPVLAVATAVNVARQASCDTGPIQCCQSTETAGSASGAALLASIGAAVQDPSVLLGVNCSPISVVGVGSGSACNASPVCCQNNAVVSLGARKTSRID